MREIKFKIRDKNDPASNWVIINMLDKPDLAEAPGWLFQFTGETDHDDKEIYEGDVVEVSTKAKKGYQYTGTVVFERGCWMIDFGDKNEKFPFTRLLSAWAKDSTILTEESDGI